ncbi:MAG: hypothetical protein D3922_01645 [Candidatus Electrothrix sp. AR1]|nr:hypothetical protein [Candidatus Electrothrix sp. AR1]
MKMRGSIFMRLYHFYKVWNRRSSYPILFRGCDREKTGPLYRVIKISLLLTIILTGCATPTTKTIPVLTPETGLTQEEVFKIIADDIYKSNKRRVAIIDFPDKGGKINGGEDFVKKMAV